MPRFARWSISWILLLICSLMMPLGIWAAPNAVIPTPTATPPPPTATPTATPIVPPPTATPTDTPIVPPPPTATPTATPRPRTPGPAPEPSATPTPVGDPRVVKSVQPDVGRPGDTITFSIAVHNDATIAFTNIVIDDTVPDVFEIQNATVTQGTVSVSGQRVLATIGTIEPGQGVTLVITTVIRAGTPPGQVDNVALLTTDTPGDNPGNNTSRVTVTILGPPEQPTPVPAKPTPVRVPPAKLPPTGDSTSSNGSLALVALAALVAGLTLRARWRLRKGSNM